MLIWCTKPRYILPHSYQLHFCACADEQITRALMLMQMAARIVQDLNRRLNLQRYNEKLRTYSLANLDISLDESVVCAMCAICTRSVQVKVTVLCL